MLNWTLKTLLQITLTLWAMPVLAQDAGGTGLVFQAWKDQQVLEAQNQILRASARINQLKSGGRTASPNDRDLNLSSGRIKKAADSLPGAERDLKRAQESMQAAAELQLEDYINIYLPSLQDQPDTLAKLTERLSKEELTEITKVLIRKGFRQPNARRNSSAGTLGELSRTSATPSI